MQSRTPGALAQADARHNPLTRRPSRTVRFDAQARARALKFLSYYRPHIPLLLADLACAVLVSATALFLPLCANYAQMADVLRLEVLHRHGGVYIDTDFEPIRPIDALLQGAEHVFCSEDGVSVSTGFLAAVPGSMLIRRCLDALPQRLGAAPPNVESGPGFITGQLLREGFDGGVRLLPSRLLYPYRMHEPERAAGPFPDAYAVHRWAHSWSPPRSLARRVAGRLRRLLEAGT